MSNASVKERAMRAAVLKCVSDALKAEVDAERGELFADLVNLYEFTGSKSLDVKLPDGKTKVASITLSMPKAGPAVTDRAAFEAWIAERYPHSVVTVPERREVSGAFVEQFMKIGRAHV